MSSWAPCVERTFLRCSPLYLRAERLRVATALRRESLPRADVLSCWRGAGLFARIALAEDGRFYPGKAPAPTVVRVALRITACLVQLSVSLAVAPYCGVLVGIAYLRHGEAAALNQASRHFLPLYVGLMAANVAWWLALGAALHCAFAHLVVVPKSL